MFLDSFKSNNFYFTRDSFLLSGLAAELRHSESVLWDDLRPDILREGVIRVHNIIFGQLGIDE
jgi:hypothetical protein